MTTFTIHASAARWRSPAKYSTQPGWGHGTWAACARLTATAGVGKLILTHHDIATHYASFSFVVAADWMDASTRRTSARIFAAGPRSEISVLKLF